MDPLLEATRRAEQDHFWFRGFRNFVRPLIERAIGANLHARILDCGCGTGNNLVMLRAWGRTFGFDFSWDGLVFAKEYGQPRVAHASITHIPFPDSTFDLVTAFDVLTALTNAQTDDAVRELRRVLKPGGALIVNVAALDILRGSHSVFGGELRRFTRPALRALLTDHGFDIVRLTYTNFSLFPLMLVVRTGQRMFGHGSKEKGGMDISVPPAPVNAVLTELLDFEALALHRVDMPIGSSLLCMARRPVAG